MSLNIKDALIKARISLLLDRCFWGNLALHLPLKEDNSVPTFATDGKCIMYNKAFAEKCSDRDKEFILCFTEDTLIAGEHFKKIEEVSIGDNVLTQYGKLERVKRIFKREINDDVVDVKAVNMLSIKATKEHPFLVCPHIQLNNNTKRENRSLRNQYNLNCKVWKNAEDLRKNDLLLMPRIKGVFGDKKIDITKYKINKTYRKKCVDTFPI